MFLFLWKLASPIERNQETDCNRLRHDILKNLETILCANVYEQINLNLINVPLRGCMTDGFFLIAILEIKKKKEKGIKREKEFYIAFFTFRLCIFKISSPKGRTNV